MKPNLTRTLLFTVAFSFLALSCRRDDDNSLQRNMEQLQVPEGFDFKTTRTIPVKVHLPSIVDYTDYKPKVEFFKSEPQPGDVPLLVAAPDELGRVNASLTAPSYTENIYVRTHAGMIELPLSPLKGASDEDSLSFVFIYDTLPPPNSPAKGILLTKESFQSGIQPGALKSGANLVGNGNFSLNDFGQIPAWTSPMVVDGRWHRTSEVSPASGQFNDNGNFVFRLVGGPRPVIHSGLTQLITSNQGDNITFSARVRANGPGTQYAWLYLIPRNADRLPIAFYSVQIANPPQGEWRNLTVSATMPAGTTTVQVLFWQWVHLSTLDLDDAVVTRPADSDGDGVPDNDDHYPNDPLRAFNNFFPAPGFGSLAFEDLWPGTGDYDFNDLVMDYRFKVVTSATNRVAEIYSDFAVRAIGAGLRNGFGFQLPFNPIAGQVPVVSGFDIQHGVVQLAANGSEANQNLFTVIVFDDAFNILQNPGVGLGVNTDPIAPYVEPDTVRITMVFPTGIYHHNTVNIAAFNPFLIINLDRSREIHLPDYPPTSLVNPLLFGTMNDNSVPATGRYYRTHNNLPWAINIYESFDYTIERAEIISAHLRFASWAQSGGTLYHDWYQNKPGYRNQAKIYNVPD